MINLCLSIAFRL